MHKPVPTGQTEELKGGFKEWVGVWFFLRDQLTILTPKTFEKKCSNLDARRAVLADVRHEAEEANQRPQ